jgi:predicted metal-dependent phosphoesterase TrpH
MVNTGFVRSEDEAFRKYLGSGKSCDINNNWAPLPQVIAWIRAAGGTAVLAHPGKYRLTQGKLASLVDEFAAAGGEALEVVSGRQLPAQTRNFARLASARGLLMSCGSDFHQPGQSWAQLGCYSTPPSTPTPLWARW